MVAVDGIDAAWIGMKNVFRNSETNINFTWLSKIPTAETTSPKSSS